jgi:hypothetical protein
MTLSHRWGATKFIKLTTDNLHSFKLGIPLKHLPKTFQDAVAVAKWFGVRYLWIDSLCIIQDSIADWSVEAGLMSEVYQYAFCNIAATGALDSSEGLFFNRDFNLVQRSNLEIDLGTDPWRGSGKSRRMEILNPDLWKESIQQAELNKRGWVVQERLLAKRVLHFGKMQLFWECREQRACETYPNGLHYVITTDVDFRSAMLASVTGPVKGLGKEGIWWSIVRIYSQGQLTRLLDKEMACSGLVKSLETTFKDSCIVGLWKKGMPFQLLWESGYLSTRCPYYRAPSWSWLSVDGEIAAGPMEGDSTLMSHAIVEDIVVTRAGQQNGDRIKSAYIKLKGYIKKAKLEMQLSTGSLIIDDCHSQKQFISIDGRVSKWGSGSGNVCCLLIFSKFSLEKTSRRGLILRQTSRPEHEREVYERVGTFLFEDSSKDRPTGLFSLEIRSIGQYGALKKSIVIV